MFKNKIVAKKQDLTAVRKGFRALAVASTVFVASVMLSYSPQSFAWGQNGHRIIGEIAFNHLTPKAREQVLALLSGDKLPEVTTWADEMRSNPEKFWRFESPRWHYISIDQWQDFKAKDYKFPQLDKPKDIYAAILRNITVLEDDNASAEDKEFHLRFLTHLIGDLHMPLHVGKAEDRGGNRVKVNFFGEETNLHSLWDTKLIESQKLSYKDFAEFIDTQDKKQISEYLSSGVSQWTKESFEARDATYDIGDGNLRWDYQYNHLPVLKQRLTQAGIRLAGVLNKVFDESAVSGVNAVTQYK